MDIQRTIVANGASFNVLEVDPMVGPGEVDSSSVPELIFGHGWQQSGACWAALAKPFQTNFRTSFVDFPGFGASPLPPADWGTGDYADTMAEWISGEPERPRIWIGHSFGCRVGIRMAARHPDMFTGLVLIGAAGLRVPRTISQTIRARLRAMKYRVKLKFARDIAARERVRFRYGSADYRAAGALRNTFVKVVNEDLTQQAERVSCPTLIVFGENDTETPPAIGERLSKLIPGSDYVCFPGLDHYSLLDEGRHQVSHRMLQFFRNLCPSSF